MIVCIPPPKNETFCSHICSVLDKHTVTAANLQSLAGKVNFLVKAFPLGHPFIHRLYDAAAGKLPCCLINMTLNIQKDLKLWAAFLAQFRGWLPILDSQQHQQATMVVYSDASANPKLG